MTQPDLVSKLREVSAHWKAESKRIKLLADKERSAHGREELMAQSVRYWMCADELESLLGREGQAAEPATVEVCGFCGGFLEGDYCTACDAHVEEDARDRIPAPQRKVDFCGAVCMAWEDCGDKEYTHHCVLQADHQGKHKFSCSQVAQPAPSPSTPIVPGTAGLSADWPECKEFYDLMQYYRHAPVIDQPFTVKRYELVKEWLRSQVNALLGAAKPAERTVGQNDAAKAQSFPIHVDGWTEREAQIRKDALREAFLLRPGLPHDGNSAQFREGYYAGLEAYRQAIRSALKEES